MPNGEFLALIPAGREVAVPVSAPLLFVLNWHEELTRLVPTKQIPAIAPAATRRRGGAFTARSRSPGGSSLGRGDPRSKLTARVVTRMTAAYPFLLFGSWVFAWMVNLWLRDTFRWDAGPDTIYWIAMKVMLWVAPALFLIRVKERASLRPFLELSNLRRGVRWGAAVSVALVTLTYVSTTLPSGTDARRLSFDLSLLNAVIVAPLVEEITLRGFYLKLLERRGRSFWGGNVLTTIVFLAMHVPGWFFKGPFPSPLSLVVALGPLAFLSLVFGWAKHRAESLYAAIIVHAVNNLFSAVFPIA